MAPTVYCSSKWSYQMMTNIEEKAARYEIFIFDCICDEKIISSTALSHKDNQFISQYRIQLRWVCRLLVKQ